MVVEHAGERVLWNVDDIFPVGELEEPRVRDIFLGVVTGAAADQDREPDEGKRDREKDDAPPVEIGVATGVFVVFRRCTVGLSPWGNRGESGRAKNRS